MSANIPEIEVQGRVFRVRLERRVIRSQRNVLATAFNDDGSAVSQEEMSTASARSFLGRDAEAEPPSWGELEGLALDMLKLQLDE